MFITSFPPPNNCYLVIQATAAVRRNHWDWVVSTSTTRSELSFYFLHFSVRMSDPSPSPGGPKPRMPGRMRIGAVTTFAIVTRTGAVEATALRTRASKLRSRITFMTWAQLEEEMTFLTRPHARSQNSSAEPLKVVANS